MFGRIVPRYDLLNRVMSLGMDGRWRRMAASLAEPRDACILDLGTGTGDLAFELGRQGAARVFGVDFTPEMLAAARAKTDGRGVAWLLGDALTLPYRDATFDAVTNAFLLRNLADLRQGLEEMARVLKPGGRLVCLDMTHPRPGPFATLYRLYFGKVLPFVAGTISGDRPAYSYLPHSLEGYPDAEALARLLSDIGLRDVKATRLGGGSVALHTARK